MSVSSMSQEMNQHLRQIEEEILTGCAILDKEGLVKGFGHISSRVPGDEGKIFITPRKALRLVETPDDIALVDFAGHGVDGRAGPPLECHMHLAIYKKRPEVKAICRVHSPYAYIFGILERPVRATHGWSAMLGESVAVYSNLNLITTPELGKEVIEALGENVALILRGNGSITVGGSIREAVVKSLFLEESAQLLYRALQLGDPVYVTGKNQEERAVADEQEYIRAWNYYKSKLP